MAENGITRQTRHVVRMLCGQRLGSADFWPHSMPRNPPELESKIVRMRFCQSRAQQGPAALFFELVCSMVFCLLPRQLFSGWHFDPGSQSDNGILCYIGNESDGARFAFGPPCGASSRGPASIFLFPLFSLSHEDQTGPRSTCRPRPDPFECPSFPSPMQRPGTSAEA